MKIYGFNEGDRSEYLALFGFSTVAYCAPVPRQNDHFNVDFFAHLARKDDKNLVAMGRAVCAQVKSTDAPLLLDKPEHIRCLLEPSIPFFYVVISKGTHEMKIYSTQNRIEAYWEDYNGRTWIMPGEEGVLAVPGAAQDGDRYIYLGKPIYQKNFSVLENEDKTAERKLLFDILDTWAKWEQIQLAARDSRFPLFVRITNWDTNVVPDLLDHAKMQYRYYPYTKYLEGYMYGVRLHADVLRSVVNEILASGVPVGAIPDYTDWAGRVTGHIGNFVDVVDEI